MTSLATEYIENHPFDEIQIGQTAQMTRTLRPQDIPLFAAISGDVNPTHLDPEFAKKGPTHEVVGHSMWGGALFSALLGNQLPGPGTVYVRQDLRFHRPIAVGDTLTASVTVKEKNPQNHHVVFECLAVNQDGLKVIDGIAEVIAPTEKIRCAKLHLPEISVTDKALRYRQIMSRVKGLEPITVAVAHPCDEPSLGGALEAMQAGIIRPILVGPKAKILAAAQALGADLSELQIIDTPHSHASAEVAVQLCREGKAEALMKGSLHTDELMAAVVQRDTGLRTARRISHVFLADVPTYPRPLMITDAAVNIEPTLEEKVDIVQNAIDLAHALGIAEPKVAILSAVETVTSKIRSTIDAAALCKMADRGQIKGGLLDGPLAFDNAISQVAARIKGIRSAVAGNADILVVPDLEAGNMIAKQLEYLANALMAGIVLGAKVPIVLTSRADTPETRAASCAVAQVLAHAKRTTGLPS
ncbi:bifunctional enoyl-CoA hydratase/phosphate acetyltransferase [Tepidiphilus baoligensis]|uniref:Bifunctional enoyl-CoA hydratase/phosphate acetyltransferase n=1 Tax=Tepidiphilus baoligensis TaxID=2698687 RepID=A0ABX1QJT2_9PROT|nr:bifunctional enoyl-CoA hydratase/phosphate acetyltransferase [Tepidiphilus baoligensis]NMH15671.1 bifunctional enoyl-CoA hydratase/phosphate acetyltransferase [Tepidiphilus baoligensis]